VLEESAAGTTSLLKSAEDSPGTRDLFVRRDLVSSSLRETEPTPGRVWDRDDHTVFVVSSQNQSRVSVSFSWSLGDIFVDSQRHFRSQSLLVRRDLVSSSETAVWKSFDKQGLHRSGALTAPGEDCICGLAFLTRRGTRGKKIKMFFFNHTCGHTATQLQ